MEKPNTAKSVRLFCFFYHKILKRLYIYIASELYSIIPFIIYGLGKWGFSIPPLSFFQGKLPRMIVHVYYE